MVVKIFGLTISEIFIIIFVMPVFKQMAIDVVCEIGWLWCGFAYLIWVIIPLAPIILFIWSER